MGEELKLRLELAKTLIVEAGGEAHRYYRSLDRLTINGFLNHICIPGTVLPANC